VKLCSDLGRAMRIGTNPRARSATGFMNRFGDTPLGMVESALEFARHRPQKTIFHNFKFLDEIVQPEGDDRVLPPAGRAT